jgi:hypothetical protein
VDKDELLQPTLADHQRRPAKDKPWRLGSQVYVAFFGGAFAVGAIGFLNAVRLGLSIRARLAIVAVALAAEGALYAVVQATATDEIRLVSIAAGLAAFGGAYLIQRSPDRVYHFHYQGDDEEYESLFVPGLIACVVARFVEALVIFP